MRLKTFLIADAVDSGADGKYFIHGGGITEVRAPEIPWSQPQLATFTELEREDEEAGSDHSLAVRFVDPDGQPMEAEVRTNLRIPPDPPEGQTQRVSMIASFSGVQFERLGRFAVQVLFDDTPIGERPLYVVESGEPGTASRARDYPAESG